MTKCFHLGTAENLTVKVLHVITHPLITTLTDLVRLLVTECDAQQTPKESEYEVQTCG